MPKRRRVLNPALISVLCAMPVMAGELPPKSHNTESITVSVVELRPFTHIAHIPQGVELSSIKFEGVRMVMVATQMKSTMDQRACEAAASRDSGGSMYCPHSQLASPSPAYRVTYSYRGTGMASDEYGNGYFTFSVYLRPEELSPAVIKELAEHRLTKADAAGLFEVKTYRVPVQRTVVDGAASKFCGGNFFDGSWKSSDSECKDRVETRTITTPSEYITVRVDPAPPDHNSNARR